MDMRPHIRCIYCRTEKPKPVHGEHILLESLGGSKTIDTVCDDCNNKILSKIDLDFMRSSMITVIRVAIHESNGQLKHTQCIYDKEVNAWLDWTGYTDALKLRPQLVFLDQNRIWAVAESEADLDIFKTIAVELLSKTNNILDGIHINDTDIPENETLRLVAKQERNRHSLYIRCKRGTDKADLLEKLRKGLNAYLDQCNPAQALIPQLSDPRLKISSDVNVPQRCVAKMAFNFCAHIFGAEYMLNSRFNGIRDYIMGHDVLPVEKITLPDGSQGFTMDVRYVMNPFIPKDTDIIANIGKLLPQLAEKLKKSHSLILTTILIENLPRWCSVVTIYGISFIVNIGPIAEDRSDRIFPMFLYKERNGNNEFIGSIADWMDQAAG